MKNNKKKKKGSVILWLLLLILVVGGATAFLLRDQSLEAEFFTVGLLDLHEGIKETGTVESDTTVTVSAKLSGEVTAVRVSEGDQVAAGNLLLSIDQKTANQQAAAQQLDVQSLRAQEAGLNQQYETALAQAEKSAHLYQQGAISQEEYNQAENVVRQLESELNSLAYSIQGASAAVITESGDVKAPVAGVVTAANIRRGEIAAAGMALFEISDLENIHISADLIAEDAAKVREGQRVILYGDNKEVLPVEGIVRKIHVKAQEKISELGIAQKRVTVEIALAADAGIRLGSDVDIEIVSAERSQVLAVPEKAVFVWNQMDYVYVVEEGRAVLRQVDTGLVAERFTEVQAGLEPGEVVIVNPRGEIAEGVLVKDAML